MITFLVCANEILIKKKKTQIERIIVSGDVQREPIIYIGFIMLYLPERGHGDDDESVDPKVNDV